jgi:predicted RNA binding protein YcfA (HicA-like mRNA interferase family)
MLEGRNDGAVPYCAAMAKAARVLAALKRDGWIETRRSGSHRVLAKGDQQRIWAYHEGVDLGSPALARIARDYGYTVAELRKL